jgi:S-adenosyl methyltransferase
VVKEQDTGAVGDWAPRGVDVSTAHSARIYDWYLGGKDNFPADRAAGEASLAVNPDLRSGPVQNRAFLGRAVRFLAGEAGVRQFLDIGTGIPAADNTHEVAQRIDPSARVVYVDNDPIVLAHARALLDGDPAGVTAYIDADLRDPESILAAPEIAATLDLDRPVALMLIGVLHFVRDDEDPYGIVRGLLSALPGGSFLAVSHVTADFNPVGIAAGQAAYHAAGVPFEPRTREEFGRFLDGLEVVSPGVAVASEWRPTVPADERPEAGQVSTYAAVGAVRTGPRT